MFYIIILLVTLLFDIVWLQSFYFNESLSIFFQTLDTLLRHLYDRIYILIFFSLHGDYDNQFFPMQSLIFVKKLKTKRFDRLNLNRRI